MDEDLVRQWVPDELWELAAPLVSPVRPRPQGGGTAMIDARAVLAAIVSVLTTGCAWRHLPPGFGVAVPTAHRRRPRASDKGGELTGASPVDRSKPGSKVHVVSDRGGLPLAVTVSAATTHDSQCREALVQAIPTVCSRRGRHRRRPDKLHLDNGYDSPTSGLCWVTGASPLGWPAAASKSAPGWAGTAGSASAPSPGSSATADSPSATNAPPRPTARSPLAAALTCHKHYLKHAT